MPAATEGARTRAPKPKPAPKKCDNHPDRDATFRTTSGGAHQPINFCERCVPRHWRK